MKRLSPTARAPSLVARTQSPTDRPRPVTEQFCSINTTIRTMRDHFVPVISRHHTATEQHHRVISLWRPPCARRRALLSRRQCDQLTRVVGLTVARGRSHGGDRESLPAFLRSLRVRRSAVHETTEQLHPARQIDAHFPLPYLRWIYMEESSRVLSTPEPSFVAGESHPHSDGSGRLTPISASRAPHHAPRTTRS